MACQRQVAVWRRMLLEATRCLGSDQTDWTKQRVEQGGESCPLAP